MADDADGCCTYSSDLLEEIWLNKQEFVNVRPYIHGGIRDYPGLEDHGRSFSAPFVLSVGKTIYDREREKGVDPSKGCSVRKARKHCEGDNSETSALLDEQRQDERLSQGFTKRLHDLRFEAEETFEKFVADYSRLTVNTRFKLFNNHCD